MMRVWIAGVVPVMLVACAAGEPPAGSAPAGASGPAPAPASGTSGGAATSRASEPDLSQGASTFDAGVPGTLEVRRTRTGHLLVRPKVNGVDAGWFIFDTGAGICVVSTEVMGPLNLREAGSLDAVGVGGGAKTTMHRADTVALGPITLRDHPVMTTDLSFLGPLLGETIAGVIGYGVLSRCVVEMSIGTPSVTLHDPATFVLGEGAWRAMPVHDRIPTIGAQVEGHGVNLRLDTGSDAWITLHAPAVEKWKLLEGRESADAKLGGVGGFVKAKRATLRTVTLGGVTHEDVRANFALEARGSFGETAYDGTVGAALLSKYVMTLDYANQRIALRPVTP